MNVTATKRTSAKVSVAPLLRRLKDRGIKQSKFASDHDYTPADITNWKKRGVPQGELLKVARWCGITVDAYLIEAGGAPAPQRTLDAGALMSDYEALPDGLKEIITRKAAGLRHYVDSLPTFLRDALKNAPSNPEDYRKWEKEIEGAASQFTAPDLISVQGSRITLHEAKVPYSTDRPHRASIGARRKS